MYCPTFKSRGTSTVMQVQLKVKCRARARTLPGGARGQRHGCPLRDRPRSGDDAGLFPGQSTATVRIEDGKGGPQTRPTKLTGPRPVHPA